MNNFTPLTPQIIPRERVLCGFTTRNGGVSLPPFNSLNLSLFTCDDPLDTEENRKIVRENLEVQENDIASMEQVHGKNISIAESGGIYPTADGLITSKSGILLVVLVADCVPLLLCDPALGVIGVIHCGWRSIAMGIAEEALNIMIEKFGVNKDNVIAVMGPSAGPCCYETGENTALSFRPSSIINRKGRIYLDLKAELKDILLEAGLKNSNIEVFSDCTICNEELFFSHRRDNVNSGRMMGYIMIK